MKKHYDWSVVIPPAYPTEKDRSDMCKMLTGARIIKATVSKQNRGTVIITTEEK